MSAATAEDNASINSTSSGDESADSKKSSSSHFAFRPSKLSAVTEQIWKKDATISSGGSVQRSNSSNLNLLTKPDTSNNNNQGASTSCTTTNIKSTANFIFGQNIKDRVVINEDDKKKKSSVAPAENEQKENSMNIKKSKSESDPIKKTFEDFKDVKNAPDVDSKFENANHAATLEESAKQYEEHINSAKVKLSDRVDVKTGEENEITIINISCKLHVFDGTKHNWEERGAAIFKINESDDVTMTTDDECGSGDNLEKCQNRSKTRIVARLQGSLRVVINTKLWPDMLIERVSPKRLKLSAIDFTDKSVVLYLITAPHQHEIDKIEEILRTKLNELKNLSDHDGDSSSDDNLAKIKRKSDISNHHSSPEKKAKTSS